MGRIIIPRPEDAEVDPTGYLGDMVRVPEEPKPVYFPDFQQCNPFREPDWRWQRACRLEKPGEKYSSLTDDTETGWALRLARGLDGCKDEQDKAELADQLPVSYGAYQMYHKAGLTKWLIDARILAGQSLLEVVQATGLSPKILYRYEAVFFNVHGRLGARDYIQLKVIGRTAFDSITAEDTEVLLKLLAYYGGPVVLEASLPYVLNGLKSDPSTLTAQEARILQGLQRLVAALSISDREDSIPKLLALLRQQPGNERATEKLKAVEEKAAQAFAQVKENPNAKAADHAAESETNRFDPAHLVQLAQYLRQTA